MQPNYFTQNLQTERLEALANWLEGGAKHKLHIGKREVVFDMSVGIRAMADVGEDFDPNECGTACCVAGAAVQFFSPDRAHTLLQLAHIESQELVADVAACGDDPKEIDRGTWGDTLDVEFTTRSFERPGVFEGAQKLLGLTYVQAKMLFQPTETLEDVGYYPPGHMELRDFTDPLWAARTIRTGLKTGVFNWLDNERVA